MSSTPCEHICECKKMLIKINLLKPVSVEEIESFMRAHSIICRKSASGYWDMRTIQIDWGKSSEIVSMHRDVLQRISQDVVLLVPF